MRGDKRDITELVIYVENKLLPFSLSLLFFFPSCRLSLEEKRYTDLTFVFGFFWDDGNGIRDCIRDLKIRNLERDNYVILIAGIDCNFLYYPKLCCRSVVKFIRGILQKAFERALTNY